MVNSIALSMTDKNRFEIDFGICFRLNRIQVKKSDGATYKIDFSFVLSRNFLMKIA